MVADSSLWHMFASHGLRALSAPIPACCMYVWTHPALHMHRLLTHILVDQPFLFTIPAEPAILNQPTPVCGKGSCDTEAKQNLQAMVHQMETALGTNIANTEVHLCAKCGKTGADKMCSRCMVTPYCSRNCRKDDWSKHKKACHPAKPMAGRLSQFV